MSTETITPFTGIVVDKETNEPIWGAWIYLFTFLDVEDGSTETHKDGSFSITPDFPSQSYYTVKIEATKYRTLKIQVDPSLGQSSNLGTLQLEKAPS